MQRREGAQPILSIRPRPRYQTINQSPSRTALDDVQLRSVPDTIPSIRSQSDLTSTSTTSSPYLPERIHIPTKRRLQHSIVYPPTPTSHAPPRPPALRPTMPPPPAFPDMHLTRPYDGPHPNTDAEPFLLPLLDAPPTYRTPPPRRSPTSRGSSGRSSPRRGWPSTRLRPHAEAATGTVAMLPCPGQPRPTPSPPRTLALTGTAPALTRPSSPRPWRSNLPPSPVSVARGPTP